MWTTILSTKAMLNHVQRLACLSISYYSALEILWNSPPLGRYTLVETQKSAWRLRTKGLWLAIKLTADFSDIWGFGARSAALDIPNFLYISEYRSSMYLATLAISKPIHWPRSFGHAYEWSEFNRAAHQKLSFSKIYTRILNVKGYWLYLLTWRYAELFSNRQLEINVIRTQCSCCL